MKQNVVAASRNCSFGLDATIESIIAYVGVKRCHGYFSDLNLLRAIKGSPILFKRLTGASKPVTPNLHACPTLFLQ